MSLLCGVPAAWYRYRVSLVGSQNTSHGNKCVSHVSNRAESEYFSQYFSQSSLKMYSTTKTPRRHFLIEPITVIPQTKSPN